MTPCTKASCKKRTCRSCEECEFHNCSCSGPPRGLRATSGPAVGTVYNSGAQPSRSDRVLRQRDIDVGMYAEGSSSIEGSVAGSDAGMPSLPGSAQTDNAMLIEALRPMWMYLGFVQGSSHEATVDDAERCLERIRHFPAARMRCLFSDLRQSGVSRWSSRLSSLAPQWPLRHARQCCERVVLPLLLVVSWLCSPTTLHGRGRLTTRRRAARYLRTCVPTFWRRLSPASGQGAFTAMWHLSVSRGCGTGMVR